MKQIIIVGLCLLTFSIVACKKDRTCICTEFYDGASTSWTEERDTIFIKMSKKEANEKCNGLDGETQVIFTETYGLDCELK